MVAGITGDVGWLLVIWLIGALVSLMGALCYAELCTAYPHAGGDYHFLHRAFGRHVSFLYAWARATVINTGSIALLAFVFGDYFSQVCPGVRMAMPTGHLQLSWGSPPSTSWG
jgi:amino acid transporter